MRQWLFLAVLALMLVASQSIAAPKALFDNAHAQTAGNADWVIDNNQPVPSPAQSGIGANTAGTFWTGAISSWGVDLVKRGYTVHTNTSALTYGNAGNTYDLSNYDVLIVDEPNTLFTAAEATAIFNFLANGGGLVAVSDHYGSDRNSDGQDSPRIWNALDPSHLLGVHFAVSGESNNNIVQTSTNVRAVSSDSITRGSIGNVTGLAFHNGTTMTLYPAVNPSVRGEVWMNGLAQTSTTGVMCASAVYGNGRVVWVGDSSPADDGSAQAGNSSIYDGWGEAGATDSTLFLNATLWATRRTAPVDATPPVVSVTSPVGGEAWKVASSHAITWSATDNVGVTAVDLAYSTDGGSTYPNSIATNLANSGSYAWTVPNAPGTTVRVRATARDAAGNSGTGASAANFTIDRWTLTASAGSGGTISPSGTVYVAQGGSQVFTIAANTGYVISAVTVDGTNVGAVTSYTFSNVTANHTIAATFAASSNYTITASAGANGAISPSGSVVVAAGGSQAFTITPNSGYHVGSVTVDGTSVGALTSYTFSNVTANHTIAATFASGSQAPWPMASGNYSEAFGDIANWTNNFASGVGASRWASVAVGGSGTIPNGSKTTTSTATFVTGTTGGVQKGVSPNPTGTICLLATGTTDNSSADAIDLLLDFTGVNAGTLGFTWQTVFNSTGDRKGSLRVYTSTDGATFTELTGAAVLNFTNNVAGSGTIASVALPASFSNSATARIRFYYSNGTGGTTGSRPKVAIDNVSVTGGGAYGLLARAGATEASRLAPEAPALELALARPAPNPSADATTLAFTLPRAGTARLDVIDLAGRRVWSHEGVFAAGVQGVRWDGRGSDGSPVRAGVYFVRLVTAQGERSARLVRL